jgi:uncharacterized protein YcbX
MSPFSLIGLATLAWLQQQLAGVVIDARRFRPNVVVSTAEPFIEETWVGRVVTIGTGPYAVTAVLDRVLQRCVMVGLGQPGLAGSAEILRRIAQRRERPLCLAASGHITGDGVISAGDPVTVG